MVASTMQAYPAVAPTELDGDLGYGQLFSVLVRRKLWVLGALAGAIAIAAAYTSRQEPTYTTSMQLLVEPNYQSKNRGDVEGQFSDTSVQVDTATQLSLLKSSRLLERAMVMVQDDYPEFDVENPGAVQAFRRSLKVAQLAGEDDKKSATKIFVVRYSGSDPVKTKRVLAALETVYQEYNLEQQELRLEKGLAFINRQLPEVRASVQQAEAELEQFRSIQGVINPELQSSAQVQLVNQLEQELRGTETQWQELKSRYVSLLAQIGLSEQQALLASRLAQSSRYQNLLNQVQETELSLVQQRLRFQDVTPQVDQLNQQRQQQLNLLGIELGRVLNVGAPLGNSEALLYQGQLSAADVNLVNSLVAARIELDTTQARYQSLLYGHQEALTKLKRFPKLLAEYSRLLPEIETNRKTLQRLLAAQQELGLEIARGGFDWQVVEEPLLGYATPVDWKKNLLLGGVAGLMVGGMAAFAREALDDMVHTSEDLQKQVPVPLVGMVPALHVAGSDFGRMSRKSMGGQDTLAPAMQSLLRWPGFREAMDLVYQNMQFVNTAAGLSSVVVTSALAGEGKSTLSMGLAFSAARLHRRVLLIDADLRRPSLHKLMDLPNTEGLSTYLMDPGRLPKHLTPAGADDGRTGISVLTSGPLVTDPAKLLSSPRLGELIAQFQDSYDLVVVDAPPSLGMVDSMLLSAHCDGTLLVGRMDRLTKTELSQTLENLKHLNVVGVVANGISTIRQPYAYVAAAEN